jgi:hypothetical protein
MLLSKHDLRVVKEPCVSCSRILREAERNMCTVACPSFPHALVTVVLFRDTP